MKNIPQLIIYDFDGVMTDNTAFVSETGEEMVRVNRSDGLAIGMIKNKHIKQLIISTESNPVVSMRGKKLGIDVIQNCKDKKKALLEIVTTQNISLDHCLYVGNDINDLEAIKVVGQSVAPADAHECVKKKVTFVTKAKGGEGVIRELYDRLF